MSGINTSGVTIANRFTTKLCIQKGWGEDNFAVQGTTIDDLLSDLTKIPSYSRGYHKYWLFGETLNSTGFKTSTPTTYKTKLLQLLEHVHTIKGWPKSKMKVLDGFYVTDSNWSTYGPIPAATTSEYLLMIQASKDGCNEFGINHFDLYPWMQTNVGDVGLDSLGRHPLDTKTNDLATYVGTLIN